MPGRLVKSLVIIVAGLVLAILAASLVTRVVGHRALERARAEVESRWGALDPRAFNRSEVSAEVNAASWLAAGASAIVWSDDERHAIGTMSPRSPAEWRDDERAVLDTLWTRNGDAIATARRAVGCPESSWDVAYEEGFEARLPALLEQLNLSRLVLVSARSDVAGGDLGGALDDAALLARQADSLEAESVLIIGLVGLAVERMELEVLADLVAAPGVDHETLDRIESLVLGSDLAEAFRRQLRFEIAASEPVLGADMEPSNFLRAVRAFGLMPLVLARSIEVVAASMEVVDTPLGARSGGLEGAGPRSAVDVVGHAVRSFVPDLRSYLVRVQSIQSLRHRLAAAVDLRRAALATGAYPDPGAVAALTTPDPFTGRPLEVEIRGDGSLSIAIPGARELAGDGLLPSAAATLDPLVLPPPAASRP